MTNHPSGLPVGVNDLGQYFVLETLFIPCCDGSQSFHIHDIDAELQRAQALVDARVDQAQQRKVQNAACYNEKGFAACTQLHHADV